MERYTETVLLLLLCCCCFNSATSLERSKSLASKKSSKQINMEINDANYTLGLDHVSFYDAETACSDLGKRQLLLETRTEAQFWIDWLTEHPEFDMWTWTNGFRQAGTTQWIWLATGAPLAENETLWGEGQPDNTNLMAQCINFKGSALSGGWEDDDCADFRLSYICEDIPKTPRKS